MKLRETLLGLALLCGCNIHAQMFLEKLRHFLILYLTLWHKHHLWDGTAGINLVVM